MSIEPALPIPGPVPVPPREAADTRRPGCLRFGLVGCALVSAALIVLLVVLSMRAKSLVGWLLARVGDQVVAASAADVTPAEKKAFQEAFDRFSAKASSGESSPAEIKAFQKKAAEALSDGTVTSEELRALTSVAAGGGPEAKTP